MKYLAAVFVLAGLSALTPAQWTVTILRPVGAGDTGAYGAYGSSQLGYACFGPICRASIWFGTSASRVDLHPAGAVASTALGAQGLSQVGYVRYPGDQHGRASLWTGSGASVVNLHPPGATTSYAEGVYGSSQVGYALIGGRYRASLWSGSAASWVDLTPAGAVTSRAFGVYGSIQVGDASFLGIPGFPGTQRASLWTGTAASWVDLNPVGKIGSLAQGVHGSNQVGWVYVGVNNAPHASLWSGTAASWVDLHPSVADSSVAWAAYGPYQVGFWRIDGRERACIWTGTAASWEDLNPAGFSSSRAQAMSSDGINEYVVGYGDGPSRVALLWSRPIGTPPPTPTLISGSITLLDTIGNAGTESIGWTLSNNAYTYTGTITVKDYGTSDYLITVPAEALAGSYTLKFKGGTFLGQTLNVNVAGTPLTTQDVDLPNGDVDQDGEVGPSDFELVVAQFGGSGSADVDNDGEVGPSDFEIVVVMFGSGDE